MTRKSYESDLTDGQWELVAPLIPAARPGGRPRSVDLREVLNGILYVLAAGCAWRRMPHDLPPGKTCWAYFDRFAADGTWRAVAARLHVPARARAGRDPLPSVAALDAQAVKTTRKGGRPGRSGTTPASGSRAASGTWPSTRSGSRSRSW
jgi:putative transposase